MKFAVFNAFAGQEVAETELARRVCLAAEVLGWEAREVASSVDVRALAPDFVIALHFFTPKLTGHPTYGCMWNPPAFMESDPRYVKNILSYDAYLTSSPLMTHWVRNRLAGTQKKFFVAPFYASCNRTPYRPPNLDNPRLLYAGTNWDGARLRDLFLGLDSEPYVDIYGPKEGWRHLRASYRGLLPFDGSSLPEALNRAGVGLCLHREEHRAAGTPSLRIFEIAASGAVGICQEHPFIREAFGDSVLYLDPSLDAPSLVAQIAEHMKWIASHRDESLAMSRKAHAIFESRFTLEDLLEGIGQEHARLVTAKAFVAPRPTLLPAFPRVQFVVRAGERSHRTLHRALESLVAQTAPGVGAIVVRYQDVDLDESLEPYRGRLPLEIVEGRRDGVRSTHLWEGLGAVSAEYFGVLDDDDALHPNHVACLLSLLDANKEIGVAYSGSIRVWEPGIDGNGASVTAPPEPAELAYAQPFDRDELFAVRNYLTSNSFLARSALLRVLPDDPELPLLEDLFLLLALSLQTDFLYSYEATCEFFWRADRSDNTVLGAQAPWTAATDRVSCLIWTQGLLAQQGGAKFAESYQAALRSRGLKMTQELRHWQQECARHAEECARHAQECARHVEECARHVEECARRDQVITNMERSKGWRMVLAWRRTRERLRALAARLSGAGRQRAPPSP